MIVVIILIVCVSCIVFYHLYTSHIDNKFNDLLLLYPEAVKKFIYSTDNQFEYTEDCCKKLKFALKKKISNRSKEFWDEEEKTAQVQKEFCAVFSNYRRAFDEFLRTNNIPFQPYKRTADQHKLIEISVSKIKERQAEIERIDKEIEEKANQIKSNYFRGATKWAKERSIGSFFHIYGDLKYINAKTIVENESEILKYEIEERKNVWSQNQDLLNQKVIDLRNNLNFGFGYISHQSKDLGVKIVQFFAEYKDIKEPYTQQEPFASNDFDWIDMFMLTYTYRRTISKIAELIKNLNTKISIVLYKLTDDDISGLGYLSCFTESELEKKCDKNFVITDQFGDDILTRYCADFLNSNQFGDDTFNRYCIENDIVIVIDYFTPLGTVTDRCKEVIDNHRFKSPNIIYISIYAEIDENFTKRIVEEYKNAIHKWESIKQLIERTDFISAENKLESLTDKEKKTIGEQKLNDVRSSLSLAKQTYAKNKLNGIYDLLKEGSLVEAHFFESKLSDEDKKIIGETELKKLKDTFDSVEEIYNTDGISLADGEIKRVDYMPLDSTDMNTYSYRRFPAYNSVIMPARRRRCNRRGHSEHILDNLLRKYAPQKVNVFSDFCIPSFDGAFPYEPDIAIVVSESKNIFIDIEIDEPYAGDSHEPIHFVDCGDDQHRDAIICNCGWIVIRFAEEQVLSNSLSCAATIFRLINNLDSNISIPNILKAYSDPAPLKRWSYEEALQMAKENFRENIIGRNFGKVDNKTSANSENLLSDRERCIAALLPEITECIRVRDIDRVANHDSAIAVSMTPKLPKIKSIIPQSIIQKVSYVVQNNEPYKHIESIIEEGMDELRNLLMEAMSKDLEIEIQYKGMDGITYFCEMKDIFYNVDLISGTNTKSGTDEIFTFDEVTAARTLPTGIWCFRSIGFKFPYEAGCS